MAAVAAALAHLRALVNAPGHPDPDQLKRALEEYSSAKQPLLPIPADVKDIKGIGTRCAKYKNNLHNTISVKLHYNVAGGVHYVERMWNRIQPGLRCAGIAANRNLCPVRLDGFTVKTPAQFKEAFKALEFDHSYDQAFIRNSFLAALERAVELGRADASVGGVISADNWNLAYLKQHAPDFGMKEPHELSSTAKRISEIVHKHINIPLVREDLYGTNIELRCSSCHNAAQPGVDHQVYDVRRYFL